MALTKRQIRARYARTEHGYKSRMLESARHRAKKRGIEFSITTDDIVIPERCPLLGIPLLRHTGYRSDSNPSLDRIDNSKGYVPGNVQVISLRANRLKSDATLAELIQLTVALAAKVGTISSPCY